VTAAGFLTRASLDLSNTSLQVDSVHVAALGGSSEAHLYLGDLTGAVDRVDITAINYGNSFLPGSFDAGVSVDLSLAFADDTGGYVKQMAIYAADSADVNVYIDAAARGGVVYIGGSADDSGSGDYYGSAEVNLEYADDLPSTIYLGADASHFPDLATRDPVFGYSYEVSSDAFVPFNYAGGGFDTVGGHNSADLVYGNVFNLTLNLGDETNLKSGLLNYTALTSKALNIYGTDLEQLYGDDTISFGAGQGVDFDTDGSGDVIYEDHGSSAFSSAQDFLDEASLQLDGSTEFYYGLVDEGGKHNGYLAIDEDGSGITQLIIFRDLSSSAYELDVDRLRVVTDQV